MGDGTVGALAAHIRTTQPPAAGFSAKNLWRMRQFHDTYAGSEKLSPLVRELPWSHNLAILSRCKRADEREFYLRLAAREQWTKRELQRQRDGALYERLALSPVKLSPPTARPNQHGHIRPSGVAPPRPTSAKNSFTRTDPITPMRE